MVHPGLFYANIVSFQANITYKFYNKYLNVIMSIQYMVLGFEPTTFSSHKHQGSRRNFPLNVYFLKRHLVRTHCLDCRTIQTGDKSKRRYQMRYAKIASRQNAKRKNIHDQIDKIVATSVPRLNDFLDFGQLFKAFGNN